MSLIRDDLPYTKKRLEDLATAMGVNSAYLWVNPSTNSFSVRDTARRTPGPLSTVSVDETDADPV